MTFEEILDQAIAMLQRRGRLTYGTLKRQFQLDDAALEDLKNELIEGQRLAVDERGNVLVWTGAEVAPPHPTAFPTSSQDRAPLAYTPSYLPKKFSPRAVPSKASASRSPCCLRISRARWNSWPTATRRRPGSCSTPSCNA